VINFARPSAQYLAHKEAIDAAVRRVLEGGTYILGPEGAAFEQAFARYCQSKFAVGVGSGTDALSLSLKACGIGPACEVITVSHTAIATVAAILAVGATPVLVDVDPIYYTLDPSALSLAITERTKAIVVVHLYGQAADMDAINAVAARHGIVVIEDCAQAAGGSYNGKMLGTLGDVACFSFFPTKNLGAIGAGGMVVTANFDIAERVRRLRQYGWDGNRETRYNGVNSCLDEIQAAILAAKLPSLDGDNNRRMKLAVRYSDALAGLPITVPRTRTGVGHVFHLYVVACDDRNDLKSHLLTAGIGAGIHYPVPVHRHQGYLEYLRVAGELPITNQLAERVLSLPIYPELEDAEIERVVETIRSYYSR
jgi:dTDP-4-amino-4,6-dideoxygalactose transaminase